MEMNGVIEAVSRSDGQFHLTAALKVLGHDLEQRAGVDAGPTVLADGDREAGRRDRPDEYCGRPGVEADGGRDDCLANWQRDSLMLVLFCTCCCCTGWPRDR